MSKVIREKKWTRKALKKAIVREVGKKPGIDQLDLADVLGVSLPLMVNVCFELADEDVICQMVRPEHMKYRDKKYREKRDA